MPINADRTKYFWQAGDPVTATEPVPATFTDSRITPLIDMFEYMESFKQAINLLGTAPKPAGNRGEFIYIAGWWLGLLGGFFHRGLGFQAPASGLGSAGPTVGDLEAFDLDPLGPEERLIDVLKQKAQAGVDVRVMGWVSFSLLTTAPVPIPVLGALINPILVNAIQAGDPGGMVSLNSQTLNAIKNLRVEPTIAKGGMLNVIGHSAGAVHIKGAVVGSKPDGAGKTKAIAFTGGLDFVEDRWAKLGHEPQAGWDSKPEILRWHDIEAAIEGPAAQGFYNHFRDMWNENLRRNAKLFNFEGEKMPSYVPGTTAVPDRVTDGFLIPSANPKKFHVQSLRTIPAFKYKWFNCLPSNPPVSYAPNGIFEIRAAWRKAILAAESYIYIEDQMYWGREIMEWINTSLRAQANLKVILLMSGQADPNDPDFDDGEYLNHSINEGLLGIGTTNALNAAQINRIRVFRAWGESFTTINALILTTITAVNAGEVLAETNQTLAANARPIAANEYAGKNLYFTSGADSWAIIGNKLTKPGENIVYRLNPGGTAPVNGTVARLRTAYGVVMHSKTTLIDDKWALIGSANVARRSLYTDWEHSVSFLDENNLGVRDFRAKLWAEHFNAPPAGFTNLANALGAWAPAWATTPSPPPFPSRAPGDLGPPYLQPVSLPLPARPMTDKTRSSRDALRDVDSRQDWGGVCPPSI